jgi:hypothetical protein
MKKTTVFAICILVLTNAYGQSKAVDIINSVNATYAKMTTIMVTSRFDLYANHTTTKVYETKTGVYRKKDGQSSYKIAGMEKFDSPKYRILANHDQKMLMVQPNNTGTNPSDKPSLSMDTETAKILSNTDNATVEDKGSYWIISILPKIGDTEKNSIWVEKSSYLITKMVSYYRKAKNLDPNDKKTTPEKPRLEITCTIDQKPKIAKADFSEAHYILLSDGKIQLSARLKGYKLINYCEQPKAKAKAVKSR